MEDSYGRKLHYLRVSVTDRCNLRCRYCMPEEGVEPYGHDEILSFDETVRLVGIFAGLGVDRVRLTGGEPLVRKDIEHLAAQVKKVPGVRFLGLTTNGVLLAQRAEALRAAGVDNVNISLDTTNPQHYKLLTRRDEFTAAFAGLQKALKVPFERVKVNCVLSPQSVEEDWMGVVALAQSLPIDVRLIEWMPMGGDEEGAILSSDEALRHIEKRFGPLLPQQGKTEGGPATYGQLEGFAGRLGIIPAISHNFCGDCNRLRLTATGDLKLCLFYDDGVALKPLLRSGANDEEIKAAIEAAVYNKPKSHEGALQSSAGGGCSVIEHTKGMFQTGG